MYREYLEKVRYNAHNQTYTTKYNLRCKENIHKEKYKIQMEEYQLCVSHAGEDHNLILEKSWTAVGMSLEGNSCGTRMGSLVFVMHDFMLWSHVQSLGLLREARVLYELNTPRQTDGGNHLQFET